MASYNLVNISLDIGLVRSGTTPLPKLILVRSGGVDSNFKENGLI